MFFILLEAQGSIFDVLLPLIMIILVFYFFMMRPQIKKQKEMTKFNNELKRGDRVVTTGGIHAKIAEIKDSTVIIEIDGNKFKIEGNSISKELSAQYFKK